MTRSTTSPTAAADASRAGAPGWPRVLTLSQAADYVGVSEWTLQQYIAAGDLEALRVPRPATAKAHRHRPMGDTMRVLRFDRRALDEMVDKWAR